MLFISNSSKNFIQIFSVVFSTATANIYSSKEVFTWLQRLSKSLKKSKLFFCIFTGCSEKNTNFHPNDCHTIRAYGPGSCNHSQYAPYQSTRYVRSVIYNYDVFKIKVAFFINYTLIKAKIIQLYSTTINYNLTLVSKIDFV